MQCARSGRAAPVLLLLLAAAWAAPAHARPAAAAAIEESLRENRKIVGGGEYSRMPGDAAHAARGGIVDHSAEQAMVFIFFGGSDARLP